MVSLNPCSRQGRVEPVEILLELVSYQILNLGNADPSPTDFAEKTIDYAEAKTAYFKALRRRCSDWQGRAAF